MGERRKAPCFIGTSKTPFNATTSCLTSVTAKLSPYSNLFVFLTYRFPNGKSRVDTVECTLADERGRWRGSGFGDLVDQRFMLNQGVQFPLKGRYGLEVKHGMRQDPLPSVANIGLRLKPTRGVSRP